MTTEDTLQITRRLDAIIALLVSAIPAEAKTKPTRDQIAQIHAVGLTPSEIGRILGKPRTAINSELAKIRSKRRRS